MSKGQSKAPAKVKHTWKPFLRLLKEARIPWPLYIIYILVQMACIQIWVELPDMKGQIMAGEIQQGSTIALYVVLTLVSNLVLIPMSVLNTWITARTERNLRQSIWTRMVHMPMIHLDTVPPTSLVTRITRDVGLVSYTISLIVALYEAVYTLFATLYKIGTMDMTMMALMGLPLLFTFLALIPTHFMHDAQYELSGAKSRYTNFLAERLSALKQVKASGVMEKEDLVNDSLARDCFKANVKQYLLFMLSEPMTTGISAVIQGVVILYGGYMLSTGGVDTASMIALFSYATALFGPAYQFVTCWSNVKMSQGMMHSVSEFVYGVEPETMERKKSFAIPDADLKLEDVSFAYEGGEKVLDHVTLEIPTGKVTAIAGPSGSGKTTVLKLLERLYQPTEGALLFGGIPAEDIHLGEWRESFGMVPQSSPLLFGTIRDNITYGIEGGVDGQKLSAAMEAANVTEIVSRLPQGLDTDVGDVGSKLSGGEKQRIAIARMMIRDPEYLLLDEATSSLDAENEYQITQALSRLMAGRTTVIVAHNLKTIEHADSIIFMEAGRVRCCGTHKELYERDAAYRRYVDLQRGQ